MGSKYACGKMPARQQSRLHPMAGYGGDIIKKIGFIGGGKCGMSLAYYFRGKGLNVSGFFSRTPSDDSEMAFLSLENLLNSSDIIFITVTDTAISTVWNGLFTTFASQKQGSDLFFRRKNRDFDLKNKIICHCSGSLSSDIFSGADPDMVCSVHPMLAFSSRHTSPEAISRAVFTLEGGRTAVDSISEILSLTGNKFKIISKENKIKYHLAACFASNFVVALCEKSELMLEQCGFTRQEAHFALSPLMRNNMDNIIGQGTKGAITGPAARGDMVTIEKHLSVAGDDTELYKMLTSIIFDMKNGGKNEDDNSRL